MVDMDPTHVLIHQILRIAVQGAIFRKRDQVYTGKVNERENPARAEELRKRRESRAELSCPPGPGGLACSFRCSLGMQHARIQSCSNSGDGGFVADRRKWSFSDAPLRPSILATIQLSRVAQCKSHRYPNSFRNGEFPVHCRATWRGSLLLKAAQDSISAAVPRASGQYSRSTLDDGAPGTEIGEIHIGLPPKFVEPQICRGSIGGVAESDPPPPQPAKVDHYSPR